ncbi:MAG: hypothetical protein EBU66_19175 [Bacteroidetes bacterium]|nr:hypothetical protein [Bacteroidota bacterium]
MSKYQADVWLGSSSGRQRVYVNSNTWNGAKEQIKTIYDVDDNDIQDLYESNDNSRSGGSIVDDGGIFFLLAIGLLVCFWKYILIISGISLVIWFLIKFFRED